jgi:hypothetical protein
VFIDADDIEQTRRELVDAGATALGEVADGSLAEIGSAPITNGDPETGVVEVPGAKLAVVRLVDGNLLGLRQALARRLVTPRRRSRSRGTRRPRSPTARVTNATWSGWALYASNVARSANSIETPCRYGFFGLTSVTTSNASTPGIAARARSASRNRRLLGAALPCGAGRTRRCAGCGDRRGLPCGLTVVRLTRGRRGGRAASP